MPRILGISAFYHDSAAALVVDGSVVAAAQEERFTRIKRDASFPTNAINYCLSESGIEIEDLDHVVFYEKPFLKFERILETSLLNAPLGFRSFCTSIPIWLSSKLYLSRIIRRELEGRFKKRILFPEHHESHAASAFYQSPFGSAAILTVDGVGEWATTTVGVGNGNQIRIEKEIRFPDSIGLLYSTFTSACGFRVNGGEGKLMGLAPYGDPVHADFILSEMVCLKPDGSFRLNPDWFGYSAGLKMMSKRFEKYFGPSRIPESAITQREMNLAASIQSVTETILIRIANHVATETSLDNLCISGGVALNCVANGRLLKESKFKNVWIAPAPGDAGGAIGAALFTDYHLLNSNRKLRPTEMPFYGPKPTDIESFLRSQKAVFESFENESELIEHVSGLIEAEQIVGWMQGRMEFGPRALGNRSILASPKKATTKDLLNQQIKRRESFRPFAPVILAEKVADVFELETSSPLMTFAARIKKPFLDLLPAATHIDGTSRIQTVTEEQNGLLYHLIKRFAAKTGCPALVNTSFNVRGEPIVCDVADAFGCFLKTELDVLVIGKHVLLKSAQPDFNPERLPAKKVVSDELTLWQKFNRFVQFVTFPVRWLVSKIVLVIVFYLLVTPIAILRRLLSGKIESFDSDQESFWEPRDGDRELSDYFKQY